MNRKIIIDCDPGHDDAVAIMMAAASSELQIMGITTVAGNQSLEKTTRNALDVIQYLGLDIKVYAGCERPLVRDAITAEGIHGKSGLDGPEFSELKLKAESKHAVYHIIESLKDLKNERITLVAIGPLTNIAMALRLAPEIKNKIDRIVMMGGAYGLGNTTPAAEFNIIADPEAAYICFSSDIPITMIGLDVTRQVLCCPCIIERMACIDNAAGRLFCDLMGFFCKKQKDVFGLEGGPLHDPLTIAYLLEPEVLKVKHMNVSVDISHSISYGRTNCDYFGNTGLNKNAEVAVGVDTDKFWDMIEKMLRAYSSRKQGDDA